MREKKFELTSAPVSRRRHDTHITPPERTQHAPKFPLYDVWYIMSDVISEYQKWKQQGEDLRVQAKQAMEARFRTLLTEAAQISEEYRADFGAQLKPPVQITAFRYKTGVKGKKPAPKKTAAAAPPPAPTAPAAKPNPKVARLQKRIAAAKKKLDDAKSAGAPTRPMEDKIYEMEDDLRLLTQA